MRTLELSDRIAAIAPVSGALWIAEPKIARPVSLLYITGTADPINPMGGRDGTEVVLPTIEGHGHIWLGGKSPLPAFILGKATSRLNANDAVWDFFQDHPKPNP
jgi:polyhydroxybutyrate depolymerase